MPKRDPAYMHGQREMIARAARECMLEAGLHRTSIRDICVRAGVSIGAFYNHFKDRNEVVVAAVTTDYEALRNEPVPTCWKDYMDVFRAVPKDLQDQATRNRMRLSYEFVAELTQVKANPAGLDTIVHLMQPFYREPLVNAFNGGEITLPLGLDRTAELMAHLYWGTVHWLFCDHEGDPAQAIEDMIVGMGALAGLKTDRTQ